MRILLVRGAGLAYNGAMDADTKKKITYIVVCVSEFSVATGLTMKEAFRYLHVHGGIDFLFDCYEAEHLLSIEDAIEDLKLIARKSGGMIA